MVIVADRGRVDEAVNVDKNKLIQLYGKPNPAKSTTHYSAMFYLEKAADMYVARAIHNAPEGTVETDSNRTARYSAALVRAKVSAIPDSIPDGTYVPDRIVEPYKMTNGFGMTQKDINSFTFPVYAREREYERATNRIVVATSDSNILILNNFYGIEPGIKLSFGESVDDDSPVFEVLELNIVNVKIPQVTIQACKPGGLINVTAGTTIRRVIVGVVDFETPVTAAAQASAGTSVIEVSSTTEIESGQTLVIGDHKYIVQSVITDGNAIVLRTALEANVLETAPIKVEKRTYESVQGNPSALRDSSGSDVILMTNSDQLLNNARYTFMTGITNDETEFLVTKKSIYNEEQNQVTLDKATTTSLDTIIQIMTASEFEERDVLLLYADNQGAWGNQVTISIEASSDYPDTCRIIRVYENGVDTGEKFEVAFKDFVDGLGKQLYVEDVINGNSNYIRVKHNPITDEDGNPALPLINDYSIWRENPTDIFKSTTKMTLEDLVYGDTDILVSDFSGLELGNRIKFGDFEQEYKVSGKSAIEVGPEGSKWIEYHLTIDRGIQVDRIPSGADVRLFSHQEFKKVQKIEGSVFPNYDLNSSYVISDKVGKLLDCGTNKMAGGHNGSIPDVGDMIQTLNKVFSNREKIEINILLDGGVYNPIYQQRLDTLAQNREDCFAFLSGDPSALDATDPVEKVIAFRNSQNINSSYSATFPDWVVVYDEYNKKNVTISTDGLAAALQSVAAEGGVWGQLAAGWNSGVLFNVLRPVVTWTETERDRLLQAQLNPLKKYKSLGLSIWGNKTNLGARSYMQMRNVRFLLIQINIILRETLEYYHWTFNSDEARETLCITLQDSLWNRFSSVLNNLQVMDRTTTQDIDDGALKIYIAVQPLGVIENIYVTLGVFSNSRAIKVD